MKSLEPARAGARTAGPLPGPIGRWLSRGYGAVVGARNRRFDAGKGVTEFDRAVISVGNLSVGGTGKTPVAMHLVGVLTRAGHRPCIAMRGYKSRRTGGSDEAAEYARAFPGVPIVAQANRTDGLIDMFATEAGEEVDCIVLDDGFQHRRIARQVDLLVVDGAGFSPEERLLPAGLLREPAASVARATHAIVMRTAQAGEADIVRNIRWLEKALGAERVSVAAREWSELRVVEGGAERSEPVRWLSGKRALAVCAIGNPAQFAAQVTRAVGGQVTSLALPDHDPYSHRAVRRVLDAAQRADAQVIVVTEKDWSKLRRVDPKQWGRPIARPRVGLEFERGQDALESDVRKAVADMIAERQAASL